MNLSSLALIANLHDIVLVVCAVFADNCQMFTIVFLIVVLVGVSIAAIM